MHSTPIHSSEALCSLASLLRLLSSLPSFAKIQQGIVILGGLGHTKKEKIQEQIKELKTFQMRNSLVP